MENQTIKEKLVKQRKKRRKPMKNKEKGKTDEELEKKNELAKPQNH